MAYSRLSSLEAILLRLDRLIGWTGVFDERAPKPDFQHADPKAVDVVLHDIPISDLRPLALRMTIEILLPVGIFRQSRVVFVHPRSLESQKERGAQSRFLVSKQDDVLWSNALMHHIEGMDGVNGQR